MNSIRTLFLPVAASLLLPLTGSYAQLGQPTKRATAAPSPPSHSPRPARRLLPVGARAVRHALPTGGEGVTVPPVGRAGFPAKAAPARKTPARALAASAVQEQWAARYEAPDNSYDGATSMAVDTAGNVYVTGYSFAENNLTGPGNYDYLTIKYSTSGSQLWLARYNGPASGDDVPTSIAVDATGNVYVSGSSVGTGTGYDYATVKYSPSGEFEWQARYNGTASSDDLAASLAVDAAGNVLVTGACYHGPSTSYDYLTVKYSASGTQQWETRYDDSGNSDELPTTLAVDGSGNAYVTGNAYFGGQGDYLTLKYASDTGQPQWEARYDGPGSGYDLVRDLAVDAAGNVVVTGTSESGRGNYDYATVRYDARGEVQWAARYNGAGNGYDEATALALDAAGNVAVTGFANTGGENWDYVTLFYAQASGQQQWQARYDGPDQGYDQAADVAVDATGHVVVTGRSFNGNGGSEYATLQYTPTGQLRWQARSGGSSGGQEAPVALAVDAAGQVSVTGTVHPSGRNADYATFRYDGRTGAPRWVRRYAGLDLSGLASQATDMAVDAAGNVLVTGLSRRLDGLGVYVTVKYSAGGEKLWEARQPFLVLGSTLAATTAQVGVDAAGQVYLAATNGTDYTTLKYDGASGRLLWLDRYQGRTSRTGVTDLVVDAAGHAYVTGYSEAAFTSTDYVTIKYSPSGQQLWRNRYNGPGNGPDEATALALDAAGNVLVTGYANTGAGSADACVTVKYSASGTELWVARDSAGSPQDLAVDAAGAVYVAGRELLKYSASGQLLWTAPYPFARALAVDGAGAVFVTSRSVSPSGEPSWATVKCDGASGQPLWRAPYPGPADGLAAPTAMTVDAAGDVYVTGTAVTPGTRYYTRKYAGASGQLVWEIHDQSLGPGRPTPVRVVVDGAGQVYVTGTTFASPFDPDFLTLKYTQAAAATALVAAAPRPASARGDGQQQLAIYPNPAAAVATVRFRPGLDGLAQVLVYNQLGQQVASLYEGPVRQGQPYELPLNSEKLAPGLYTCSLRVGGQRETVRLLVTR